MKNLRDKVIISKSNNGIYVQLVKISGKTEFGQRYLFDKTKLPVKKAFEAGEEFGKKVITSGVELIVFDRAKNLYHGQVKAFADGMRKSGLQF